ncbi:hypothetical protein Plhal304r1_c047g0129101 [Plasmopara halstedii]
MTKLLVLPMALVIIVTLSLQRNLTVWQPMELDQILRISMENTIFDLRVGDISESPLFSKITGVDLVSHAPQSAPGCCRTL